MKALKVFIKPCEALQRSANIQLSEIHVVERVNQYQVNVPSLPLLKQRKAEVFCFQEE